MTEVLVIGELARLTGVSAKTIRYYEQAGLVPEPKRAANGYRVYTDRAVHLLRFVKRARDLGFAVEDVSSLLALWDDETRASADVRRLAAQHLAEVHRKIAELQGLAQTLQSLVKRCHGDHRPDCPILEDLASPPATAKSKQTTAKSKQTTAKSKQTTEHAQNVSPHRTKKGNRQ
ncbi:MAG: hypothetical protein RJA70_4620 [Pseudomonadota bacterium]|jgi:Cu(I)-responsive transcriptional regulator